MAASYMFLAILIGGLAMSSPLPRTVAGPWLVRTSAVSVINHHVGANVHFEHAELPQPVERDPDVIENAAEAQEVRADD